MRIAPRLLLAALPLLALPATFAAQERRPVPAAPTAPEDERAPVAYDVRDLCSLLATQNADEEAAVESRREALAHLVELVRDNVAGGGLRGSLAALGNEWLVVAGTEVQQTAVRQFLDDLRGFSTVLFDLQFQQVSLPAERAAALGLGEEVQFLVGELASLPATLAELAATDPAVEVMSAPRVLAYNNRKTLVDTKEQVPYVAEYVRYESVAPKGAPLVDPVVRFVEEGTSIECRPVGHHDQKYVTVELSAEFKQIQRPIEAQPGELGPTCTPTVETQRVATTVVVPDGGTVAFPAVTSEGRTSVLLMKITRIDPERR